MRTTLNIMALYLQMDDTGASIDDSHVNTPDGNASANTLMPSIGIFHVRQVNQNVEQGDQRSFPVF